MTFPVFFCFINFVAFRYEHDVDKEMVQLKFVNSDDEIIGAINWFPVHPVSMNNTNGYITSDNVGYASILLEKELNDGAFPGQVRKL